MPAPEPRSATRSSRLVSVARTIIVLSVLGAGVAALTLGALFLGGSAVFTGLIVAVWPAAMVDVCSESVDEIQDQIRDARAPRVKVAEVLERAETLCARGDIGFWELIDLEMRAEDLLEDGRFDQNDLEILDSVLDRLEQD